MFSFQRTKDMVAGLVALLFGLPVVYGAGVAARIDIHPAGNKEVVLEVKKETAVNGYVSNIGWGVPEERKFGLIFTIPSINDQWQTAEFSFTPDKNGELYLFLLSTKTDGNDKWVLFDDIKVEGARLKNSGFEDVSPGKNLPVDWEFRTPPAELITDKTISASGNNCIKVFHNQPAFQRITVTAGIPVKVSCTVKLPPGEKK